MAKKYNICLDIGGTKILGVIFDQDKNIVYRIKKKTKKDGDSTDNVEKVIISVVEEMLEDPGSAKKRSPRSQRARRESSIRPRVSSCSPPTCPGETMTSSPPWRRNSAFPSISATM